MILKLALEAENSTGLAASQEFICLLLPVIKSV